MSFYSGSAFLLKSNLCLRITLNIRVKEIGIEGVNSGFLFTSISLHFQTPLKHTQTLVLCWRSVCTLALLFLSQVMFWKFRLWKFRCFFLFSVDRYNAVLVFKGLSYIKVQRGNIAIHTSLSIFCCPCVSRTYSNIYKNAFKRTTFSRAHVIFRACFQAREIE